MSNTSTVTPQLSWQIKIASLICITLVLYIHCEFHDEIADMPFNCWLQRSISYMIGTIAVPLFFCMSGFLFFVGVDPDRGGRIILNKMRRRVSSLLIPYLIACAFLPLFQLALSYIPAASQFVNGRCMMALQGTSIPEGLYKIFCVSDDGAPLNTPLWFLRNLIVIVALCPILYQVRKLGSWVCVVFMALALYFSAYYGIARALFWFMLGSFFLARPLPRWSILLLVPFFALRLFIWAPGRWDTAILLLGIVGGWALMAEIAKATWRFRENFTLSALCTFTFFTYLFHTPTIHIFRKGIVFVLGPSSASYAISYLLSPILYTIFSTAVAYVLARWTPGFFRVISGGRGLERTLCGDKSTNIC